MRYPWREGLKVLAGLLPPLRLCPTSPGSLATSSPRRNRSAAAPNTFTSRNLQFSPIWFPTKAPARCAMIDRPDGTDFPASKIYRKPNFETLPQISPRLSPQAARVQPPTPQPSTCKGRRARAPSPGLRGAGDKEAAAAPRPPGPSPRGQLRAPPHSPRAPPPPCRHLCLTSGSRAGSPAPAAAAARRTMAGGGAGVRGWGPLRLAGPPAAGVLTD